ncbi:MAG: UDP-N-acetylmuramoyl-tripeptide--D-alanyl-D-alanine ligase [Candidatus Paceibacterota bacterium]|jgi:UDP-N-acetylmuramoyl-tripeptide--D-alanyl-D-alanine ligase
MKNLFKKIITKILIIESKLVLRKYKPKIIAITGTVGKTSTKDAVYSVLKHFYFIRKSDKSYNSEIGIPLTILGCPNGWGSPSVWLSNIWHGVTVIFSRKPYPEWLVLETGVSKPGDMEAITQFIIPDIVIVTRFSEAPVHVEFFKSPAHLIEEKSKLMKALKASGTLILNADDSDVLALKQKTKNKTVTYGFSEDATLSASHEQIMYDMEGYNKKPQGISFKVNYEGSSLPVIMNGVFSKNFIYAGLAALAVARDLDLDMLKAIEGLSSYESSPGRLKLIEGLKESLIIDDTYNSSPIACEAALETLNDMEVSGSKIAVLGDMLELGKFSPEAHKKIGEVAAGFGVDFLVTVGKRAHGIAEGALAIGMPAKKIFQFEDSRSAGKFIEQMIKPGDMILIKGSQGTRMERAVLEVMAHPEDREKLLVRQEEEWQRR